MTHSLHALLDDIPHDTLNELARVTTVDEFGDALWGSEPRVVTRLLGVCTPRAREMLAARLAGEQPEPMRQRVAAAVVRGRIEAMS